MSCWLQNRAPQKVREEQVPNQLQKFHRRDKLQSQNHCPSRSLHVDGRRLHLHLEESKLLLFCNLWEKSS